MTSFLFPISYYKDLSSISYYLLTSTPLLEYVVEILTLSLMICLTVLSYFFLLLHVLSPHMIILSFSLSIFLHYIITCHYIMVSLGHLSFLESWNYLWSILLSYFFSLYLLFLIPSKSWEIISNKSFLVVLVLVFLSLCLWVSSYLISYTNPCTALSSCNNRFLGSWVFSFQMDSLKIRDLTGVISLWFLLWTDL